MTARFQIAAIQSPAGQIDGPVSDLDALAGQVAEAAAQGARLIVCPECAYPAYFLRSAAHYRQTAAKRVSFEAAMQRFSRMARDAGAFLASGIVEDRTDGRLSNAAVLFDPAGRLLLTYRKIFLWHFDQTYFVPGDEVPVIDTAIGRLGLMICADGRCPELAAIAGWGGVQVLINPTAWVSTGRDAASLTNPQVEYFIPARAMETGCWIVSANKVGVEADSIVYCGRSNVVSPTGERVGMLGSDQPGVLRAEVDLAACRPAVGPPSRHDDEPPTYPPVLFAETATLTVTKNRALSQFGPQLPVQPTDALVLAALAGPLDSFDPTKLLADLAAQGVHLVVVAEALQPVHPDRDAWVQAANRFGMILCFAGGPVPGHGVTRLRLAGGPVDSFAPARAAMLNDAQLFVAHPDAAGRCPDDRLLRTRAAENRIFVVAAAPDRAVVVGHNGAVLGESLAGRAMAVVVRVMPDDVRDKLMAPGTDVVAGRDPHLYATYLREPNSAGT